MKTKTLTASLALAGLLGGSVALNGQTIFAENFDYALSNNTNIGGNTGGTWLGGTNNVRFVLNPGPSFTGTGYVAFHDGGSLESGNSNSSDVRTAHAPLGQTVTGEFWVSAFVNPTQMTNINGSVTQMSFSTGTTSNANYGGPGFGIYNSGTSLNYALFNGSAGVGGVTTVGTAATANQWQLLIARITINESADDAISLWSFAADADVPTTVAALGTPVVSSTTVNWGNSINTLGLGGQSFTTTGGKTALWDDLRLSISSGDTGLEDVLGIPEPSTYAALFGLLALGFVAWRRRR